MNCIFKGVATALTTPFTKNGIDYHLLEKQIDRQLQANVDALVLLGTTGESPTVTKKERREIILFAKNKIKGKIPLIVGTGSNCTYSACQMTSEAKQLGADCALIVTPYYNRCEQEGLILHYDKISKECKFPYIIYNVPTRTGVNVEPYTANTLLRSSYAMGIKEANPNVLHVKNLFDMVDNNYSIYCGNDSLTTLFFENNCAGTISVASNIIPCKIKSFISDFKSNYEKHNHDLTMFFEDFFALLSSKINPIPVKCIAEILYNENCVFRLPLNYPNSDYIDYLKTKLITLFEKEVLC